MITLEYKILEVFKKLNRPLVIADLLTLGDNREFINKVLRKMIKNEVIEREFKMCEQYRYGSAFTATKMQFEYRLK